MQVNTAFLSYIFGALVGGADDDDMFVLYQNLDVNNEESVKQIIDEKVKPEFESYPLEFKSIAKRTLSYFLTTNDIDFQRVYDSKLLPFEHPDEPKKFFIWLWEILFKNENYLMPNPVNYNVITNYEELLGILKKYKNAN